MDVKFGSMQSVTNSQEMILRSSHAPFPFPPLIICMPTYKSM